MANFSSTPPQLTVFLFRSERISEVSKLDASAVSVFLVWLRSESTAHEVKRRSRTVMLGGRSVQVNILAESPSLQEQYKNFIRMQCSPSYVPLYLSGPKTRSFMDKENHGRRSTSASPRLSTAVPRLETLDIQRVGRRSNPLTRHPPEPFDFRRAAAAAASSKSVSFRLSSGRASVEGLPTPLARSTSLLRHSERIKDVFHTGRSLSASPTISRARSSASLRSPSILSDRTHTLNRMTGPRSTMNSPRAREEAKVVTVSPHPHTLPSKLVLLKQDLADAKESYARSLDKVKEQLALMEQKHDQRTVKMSWKTRRSLGSIISF